MNVKELVGQKFMIGINKKTLNDETASLLKEIRPGSVILFKRNITSALQVKKLITEIKGLFSPSPLIAIDQEGGLVVRFTKDLTIFPGNMALGAIGSKDVAYQQGLISASELKNIGIDINLAPVVDVITTYHNPGITIRSFGDDPFMAGELGAAYIRGTQMTKVAAVAKHFPGKGAAQVDAHLDLPLVSIPQHNFLKTHFAPFKKAIENGVKAVMTTHIYCPSLDKKKRHPATFSKEIVTGFLRKKLCFKGVIFSDDLEMGAINRYYPIEDVCVKSVISGHDMLLICSDYNKQLKGFYSLFNAYKNELLSLKDLKASVKRISLLRNFCRQEPDELYLQSGSTKPQVLAQNIADSSICLVQDKRKLIPIKNFKEKRIVFIIPDLSPLDSIEEEFISKGDQFFLNEFKKYSLWKIKSIFIPIDICNNEIEKTLNNLHKNDLIIVFIFDAQSNIGQRELLKNLQKLSLTVIFILVRNPFDIEFVNSQNTCLVTYGFRKSQLLSLLKVIFGKIKAKGDLPFKKNEA